MWRVSFRQDEMLEVDDTHSFRAQPAVRHGSDVILRRHGLKDGYSEDHQQGLSTHNLTVPEGIYD